MDPARPTTAKQLPLHSVGVKYILIDFGLSIAWKNAPRTPTRSTIGSIRYAPELARNVPIDGFALDVFCIGAVVVEKGLNVSTCSLLQLSGV